MKKLTEKITQIAKKFLKENIGKITAEILTKVILHSLNQENIILEEIIKSVLEEVVTKTVCKVKNIINKQKKKKS